MLASNAIVQHDHEKTNFRLSWKLESVIQPKGSSGSPMKSIPLFFCIFAIEVLFSTAYADVLFDTDYVYAEEDISNTEKDIDQLTDDVNSSSDRFAEILENTSNFKGVYVKVENTKSLDSDYFDRKLALEFELFDDGWGEAKIKTAKKRLQSKLQYLQLQNNMQLKQVDNSHYRINQVKNYVYYKTVTELVLFYTDLVSKRKIQLAEGYIDQLDFIDVEYKLEKAKTSQLFYQTAAQQKLSLSWFDLLNKIEKSVLKDEQWMEEKAADHSYDLRIQDIFISRSDFQPKYLDNVSLRLSIERRNNNRLLIDAENLVSVRVRLPIDFNKHRNEIIDTQKNSYLLQKEAIKLRLREKIESNTNLFEFKKKTLINLQHDYDLLTRKAEVAKKQKDAVLLGLKYTPERMLDNIAAKKLNLKTDILITRLDMLNTLVDLGSLIGIKAQSYEQMLVN